MEFYTYDRGQYMKLEEILKYINRNFVTVGGEDVKDTNPILIRVLNTIITAMRSVSSLFNCMYETPMYGGSFYDGLKVGQPNEFDIDLKLKLPKILNAEVIPSSEPGFVYVHLKDWDRFKKDKQIYSLYKDLEYLKDSYNYLVQEKVLRWVQKIVAVAFNKIKQKNLLSDVHVSFSMSGPAATLHIFCNNRRMDVDLVAVFRMPSSKWPASPFRKNPNNYGDFYVVPKAPKTYVSYRERCWRLSFQEQEQDIINGHNFCKPALRLLKKLRDTRDHNISSYFIKTVFLWKLEEESNLFWNKSLNFVFMEMLETYKNYLDDDNIPYYWNDNNNMLQYTGSDTVYNIKNYLQRMINTIHRNIDSDQYIIAKFLLPEHEYIQLVNQFKGTVYTCESNDNRLYSEFKAEEKRAEGWCTLI